MTTCAYGDHPVDRQAPDSRQRARGWVVKHGRRAGALADIELRETIDEWACGDCLRRLRVGLSPGQEGLL